MEQYQEALRRCLAQCRVVRDCEQEKRRALLSRDLSRIDVMLKCQQAEMMKLSSLEQKRMEAQAAAGYGGMTGEQMLAALRAQPEKAQPVYELLCELREVAAEISLLNESAQKLAKGSLHMLEQAASRAAAEQSGTYRPGARLRADYPSGTSFAESI